jgi:hypothetical protein
MGKKISQMLRGEDHYAKGQEYVEYWKEEEKKGTYPIPPYDEWDNDKLKNADNLSQEERVKLLRKT